MPNYTGIALGYKARVGKDTTATALAALDPRFTRVAFADELKRMAAKAIDKPEDFFFNEENKIKHRQFLIQYGQAFRAYDEDFWVKKGLATVAAATPIVICDMRFPNEAAELKRLGFLLVKLTASKAVLKSRRGIPDSQDPSEVSLDDYDDWDLTFDTGKEAPEVIAAAIFTEFGPLPAAPAPPVKPVAVGDRVRITGVGYNPAGIDQIGQVVSTGDDMVQVRLDQPINGKVMARVHYTLATRL